MLLLGGGLFGLGLPLVAVVIVALAALLGLIMRRVRQSRAAETASSEAPSEAAADTVPPVP